MSPTSPIHDSTNGGISHAKRSGDARSRLARTASRANFGNIFRRQLRTKDGSIDPSFGGAISHVVGLSPQKQMGGIHAFWVVAGVKNIKTIWDSAYMKYVREPMGFYLKLKKVELPVGVSTGEPCPALVRRCPLIDFREELLGDGTLRVAHGHSFPTSTMDGRPRPGYGDTAGLPILTWGGF